MDKRLNITTLLWLALALALAGSLSHLAEMFAAVNGHNAFLGWVQAVAVDAGLFALAYSVKQRRADKRPTKILWAGLSLFVSISIYANLAYGLSSVSVSDKTFKNMPWLIVVTMPYVLSASLPVLVLFLSELLSDDRQYDIRVAKREAKKETKPMTNARTNGAPSAFKVGDADALTKANDARRSKVTDRQERVLSLLGEGLAEPDIAEMVGVSERTIKRDIKALNGRAK